MNFVIPSEYSITMVESLPLSGLVGIFGALFGLFGFELLPAVLISTFAYVVLDMLLRIYVLGDTDHVSQAMEIVGVFATNFIVFRYFF